MAEVTRGRTIDVEEDPGFQRGQWRISRLVWACLLVTMAATLLGVFGNGPLSRAHAADPGAALSVEYQRVVRLGSPTRLVVHARSTRAGPLQLRLGRSLLQAFRLEQVTPEPMSAVALPDGVEYRFETGASDAVAVTFDLEAATPWRVAGWIGTPGGTIRISQFVLP